MNYLILHSRFQGVSESKPEIVNTTLPKLIHMTWLGSQLPYSKFLSNIQSYSVLNPDHQIFLWLDHSIPDNLFESYKNVIIKDVNKQKWTTEALLFKLLIKVQKSEPLLQKWSYLSAQWANFAQIFRNCSWDMFL